MHGAHKQGGFNLQEMRPSGCIDTIIALPTASLSAACPTCLHTNSKVYRLLSVLQCLLACCYSPLQKALKLCA